MTILDCRLIPSYSPLRPLIVDPVQEGIYHLFHASVISEAWKSPQALVERFFHLGLGLTLLCPIIGTIALQILIRVSTAYEEGFDQALKERDAQKLNWYLNVGVSPNTPPSYCPPLFRTQDPKVIQLLIKYGADTRCTYHGQSFFDYLLTNNLKDVARQLFDGMMISQDEEGLRKFIDVFSFDVVYQSYLEFRMAHPTLKIDWMWNALYEIPAGHFAEASNLQKQEAITEFPLFRWEISELLTLFDTMNFTDPNLSNYVPPSELKNSLNNDVQYEPKDIRMGLENIIQAVETRFHVYELNEEEAEGYILQLQWILYYLKKGPMNRLNANIIVEMGKTCLMCPGRYNDLFDNVINRLKGEPVQVPTFKDQLIKRFAHLRNELIDIIVHDRANGCTHARDNLVFHLHQEKGLVATKPKRVFTSQGVFGSEVEVYEFVFKNDALEAFDRVYTPEAIVEDILECVRDTGKKTQKKGDFNELLFDAMIDNFAQKNPGIRELEMKMKEQINEKTLFEDQRLSEEEVEELFRPLDSSYQLPKKGLAVAEYFTIFKSGFLGPKIRPLSDETFGYALPEVVHPLILGEFLVDHGHLLRRD